MKGQSSSPCTTPQYGRSNDFRILGHSYMLMETLEISFLAKSVQICTKTQMGIISNCWLSLLWENWWASLSIASHSRKCKLALKVSSPLRAYIRLQVNTQTISTISQPNITIFQKVGVTVDERQDRQGKDEPTLMPINCNIAIPLKPFTSK